jgi:hypothetical protein
MASFVVPAGVPIAIPGSRAVAPNATSTRGLGQDSAWYTTPDTGKPMDFTGAFLAAYAPYLIGGAVLLIMLSTRK